MWRRQKKGFKNRHIEQEAPMPLPGRENPRNPHFSSLNPVP